jgi:hypothetical protein
MRYKTVLRKPERNIVRGILEIIREKIYKTHDPLKDCQCNVCLICRELIKNIEEKYNTYPYDIK